MHQRSSSGFTLIELSVVMVIIGLIIGGILMGKELIVNAGTSATVTQIQKYQTAMLQFREKYSALPGDMPPRLATRFGFTPRNGTEGTGDGNGVLEDCSSMGIGQRCGETVMFWVDLTTANGKNVNYIAGDFLTASPNTVVAAGLIQGTELDLYFPKARSGNSNYISVYSTHNVGMHGGAYGYGIINYFNLSGIQFIAAFPRPAFMLTVIQAYNMDKKIDDGYPQTGAVLAQAFGQWVGGDTGPRII